jgi:2-keto-4-pentenoate hydratase/2-oxohepta-3-ene-1,7-dioic acid hydratase in catechol pathway
VNTDWASTAGSPFGRPGKILGSGINYRSHFTENPAAVMPIAPGFFAKFPTALAIDGDDIVLPYDGCHADYEVELAVVVGETTRAVDESDALRHVYGYAVANDVSERIIQFEPQRHDLGKGIDTFSPIGSIVPAAEVTEPGHVRLRSWVNGELRQDASTADMVFPIARLIAEASRYTTLEPGDVILTGTPAGCGTFRSPPLWLRPGDVVEVEAQGIGKLVNNVVAGW